MEKEVLEQKIESEISEWSGRIEFLKAKLKRPGVSEEIRDKYTGKVRDLVDKEKEARKRLSDLRDIAADESDEVAEKALKASDDLKDSVDRVLEEVATVSLVGEEGEKKND